MLQGWVPHRDPATGAELFVDTKTGVCGGCHMTRSQLQLQIIQQYPHRGVPVVRSYTLRTDTRTTQVVLQSVVRTVCGRVCLCVCV